MCGIFGYIGSKTNTAEMILNGLKSLEYRGYDSWGIATAIELPKSKIKNQKSKLIVEKHVGKIGNPTINLPKSSIGMGHTRWATHGGVTVKNAHPHLDCSKKLAIIHNGIVENFSELKDELVKKGHIFISETDTEVIVHLIEEYLKKQKLVDAIRNSFNRLHGLNAIVVLHASSSQIIAAKNGSPLVVGMEKNGLYIASDAAGIIPYTRKLLFLKDNEIVVLSKTLELYSLPKGKKLKASFETINWKLEDVTKGKYPHFMLKEIYEQPKVIENVALNFETQAEKLSKLIKKSRGTFMLGCGTASYAALSGVYMFSRIAKRHVNFSIGSEFKYLEDYLTSKSLLIPISQSGETIDVVEPVSNAKKKGVKVAAIVNVLGSTLYRLSDYNILLGAGPEKAVIGTKSFTAMVAILLQCAYAYINKSETAKNLLLASSKDIKTILNSSYLAKIKGLAKKLEKVEHLFVIGRGLSYATALETTLKLKETCYIHAEGFAGGELKHGVIALIEKGTPCIVIAPNDETFDEIISNAQEIKARGGFMIGIGPKDNKVFDVHLKTADVSDATMISQVVIVQLLAYELALTGRNLDPDKPRNLAKSVTVK